MGDVLSKDEWQIVDALRHCPGNVDIDLLLRAVDELKLLASRPAVGVEEIELAIAESEYFAGQYDKPKLVMLSKLLGKLDELVRKARGEGGGNV